MRKKIIKSYFFNNTSKNPSTSSLFCFSKRAFKQNKQQQKAKQWFFNTRKSKKTIELIKYYVNYKNKVHIKINLNQWSKYHNKILTFFLNSFFFEKNLITKIVKYKKYTKKQLKFWLLFKNKFFKNLKKRLHKFPRTGVLSSHYVHILSRKNLTYQNRSKFRSKTLNLNFFNNYFYFFTKYVHTYAQTVDNKLYFFSTNKSQQSLWIDDDFYIHTSSWNNNSLNLRKKYYINIFRKNIFYYLPNTNASIQNHNILDLYRNKTFINFYMLEEDVAKKEEMYLELSKLLEIDSLSYIHLVNTFIMSTYHTDYKSTLLNALSSYVYIYSNIYKHNK